MQLGEAPALLVDVLRGDGPCAKLARQQRQSSLRLAVEHRVLDRGVDKKPDMTHRPLAPQNKRGGGRPMAQYS